MKTLILMITSLIIATMSATAKEISSNSTLHKYAKPGAPIDMRYSSEKVDINETSDVNITLTTTITNGTVSVIITPDKHLKSLNEFERKINFDITPQEQEFTINLKVKAEEKGLYYIRLLTKIDKGYGGKLRSFAIPIYVGKIESLKKKKSKAMLKALGTSENISVSKAIETIKVIKEK